MEKELYEKIIERLDKIWTLLKIIAREEIEKTKRAVLSTMKKERIYELCNGKNELSEIAKLVGVSHEFVRITVKELEETGLVIVKRIGKKMYPLKTL